MNKSQFASFPNPCMCMCACVLGEGYVCMCVGGGVWQRGSVSLPFRLPGTWMWNAKFIWVNYILIHKLAKLTQNLWTYLLKRTTSWLQKGRKEVKCFFQHEERSPKSHIMWGLSPRMCCFFFNIYQLLRKETRKDKSHILFSGLLVIG